MVPYYKVLPRAFKQFSLRAALRTALPTLGYYLTRRPLPKSDKPALFTMNILPPMATVWYHFARKNLGDSVDYVIFDCSGKLNPKDFPGARVQKFLNFYAATKSDEFLRHVAKYRKIGWICDDDMFPMSGKMLDVLHKELKDPKTASVSFRPRDWWQFEIDAKTYEPSSSYCIAFNRAILIDREKLSLAPAPGNSHPSRIGKPPGRYDTFDKANETLLQKGYRCFIVPEAEREEYLTGFSGMSGAVILLDYFKAQEQVLAYYRTPTKDKWSGNVLFGTLSSMLAIWTILELYERITSHTYRIPSLPPRAELEKIRDKHLPYVGTHHKPEWFDDVRTRLLASL